MTNVKNLFAVWGRFLFVVIILLSAFVFAMFQGGKVSWTIFYMILPFVIYSILLFFYPLSGLSIDRTIRTPRVESGGNLMISIRMKRTNRFPLLYTVVKDKWVDSSVQTIANNRSKQLFVYGWKKEFEWQYGMDRMPRGEHRLVGIEVEITDFFGWMKKRMFFPIEDTVLVYPKIMPVQFAPLSTDFDQGAVVSPFAAQKDTTMATGVRNYQAGDRVTWIHWKSFAKTQSLMTKEFEETRSQKTVILFDGRQSSTFEEQVEFVASMVKTGVDQQADLALITFGSKWGQFPQVQSKNEFYEVLVHLAKIKPAATERFDSSLFAGGRQGQDRSTVVVTGNPDEHLIKTLLQSDVDLQRIHCFVVVKSKKQLQEKIKQSIQYAKKQGVQIVVVERKQFTKAFGIEK
ncbi:DUF58 domain-containing protein [Sporosarcina sp. HYO08]|uniref:DUF58 domain-containing protein n=1 Tax=Sporosarcina sp. HYO08 TaxID=1759557 RepID=UPI00079C0A26|nr:DUF58 domain-containing protein [Sporosarcina sp. HYO08]KXH78589.1 hypothetical protein AU377_12990 [Sporosarcina sp. HYO08]